MKKLYYKDFIKTLSKTDNFSSRETTDSELMDIVNKWIQRTSVNLVNVETIYRYNLTGIAISNGFTGVRVWFMYETKPE